MNFIRQLFVWWRGQTLGTRIYTFIFGRRIGTDAAGNLYYRHRTLATHRWVIYHGIIDASKVPPEWHAWLHNMVHNPPRDDAAEDDYPWFKGHIANMTGTSAKQVRKPVIAENQNEDSVPVEYEPWSPNQDGRRG